MSGASQSLIQREMDESSNQASSWDVVEVLGCNRMDLQQGRCSLAGETGLEFVMARDYPMCNVLYLIRTCNCVISKRGQYHEALISVLFLLDNLT